MDVHAVSDGLSSARHPVTGSMVFGLALSCGVSNYLGYSRKRCTASPRMRIYFKFSYTIRALPSFGSLWTIKGSTQLVDKGTRLSSRVFLPLVGSICESFLFQRSAMMIWPQVARENQSRRSAQQRVSEIDEGQPSGVAVGR